jgi:ATP-dependent DNA helicase 2 subunit 2
MFRQITGVRLEHDGNSNADLIDGIVVAQTMIKEKTGTRKYKRRIFIVTDAAAKMDTSDVDKILAPAKKMGIIINVIGIDFKKEFFDENYDHSAKKKTPKEKNELFWHKVCADTNGSVVTLQEAISQLGLFRSKKVLEITTFRGNLELTPYLKIPVWVYKKTEKTPGIPKGGVRLSKVALKSAEPKDAKVTIERTYYSVDDPDEEVPEEKRVKAFRYGKNYVPFNQVDEKMLQYKASKGMQLLGFTDECNVPRYRFMGETYAFYAKPDDEHAYKALSAFVRALAELEKVAIIRFVMREGASEPKMGLLYPCIKPDLDFFYFNTLPFAEDIRSYPFPTFSRVNTTEQQLQVAEDLIKSMDIMSVDTDNDEPMESLKPSQTYHPVVQHFYDCLHERSLHSDNALPDVNPQILKYCYPEKSDSSFYAHAIQRSADQIEQFKQCFPLKKVEESTRATGKKRYWFALNDESQITLASYENAGASSGAAVEEEVENLERVAKRMKGDLEDRIARMSEDEIRALANNKGGLDLGQLLGDKADTIGTTDPVKDFSDMINRRDFDMVYKPIDEIQADAYKLLRDSIADQYYQKAFDCVQALRKGCIKEEEADKFNTFMKRIKTQFSTGKRKDFWEGFIVRNSVSLISSDESDINVSVEDARNFLREDVAPEPIEEEAPEEQQEDDDMFAQLE